MTDLTDNSGGLHRAQPRGANTFGPDEVARPIADVLPVRSIAGYFFSGRTKSRGQCVPHLPSFRARSARTGNVVNGSSRARSASDEFFTLATLGAAGFIRSRQI